MIHGYTKMHKKRNSSYWNRSPGASIKSMLRGMAGYGCYSLSLCDPDAAVASAWYSVGTAWQVMALSDMELGLPLKPKHTQVGTMGTWHYCPIRNLFICTLSI